MKKLIRIVMVVGFVGLGVAGCGKDEKLVEQMTPQEELVAAYTSIDAEFAKFGLEPMSKDVVDDVKTMSVETVTNRLAKVKTILDPFKRYSATLLEINRNVTKASGEPLVKDHSALTIFWDCGDDKRSTIIASMVNGNMREYLEVVGELNPMLKKTGGAPLDMEQIFRFFADSETRQRENIATMKKLLSQLKLNNK